MNLSSPGIPSPAERLLEVCKPGKGEVIASAADMPEFAATVAAVGDLPPDAAFLSPQTEEALHPLGTHLEPTGFYRGYDDMRSFSVAAPNLLEAGSVTVKGGDLPWMFLAAHKGILPPSARIEQKQIPGAALAEFWCR